MARRLAFLLLALVALGGCGDDEQPAGSPATQTADATQTTPATQPTATDEATTSTAEAPAPTTTATTRTETTPPPLTRPKPPDGASLRAAARRRCLGQARATTALSEQARRRVQQICDAVAGDSAIAITRAAREACVVVAEDTTRAGTTARAAALEVCALLR